MCVCGSVGIHTHIYEYILRRHGMTLTELVYLETIHVAVIYMCLYTAGWSERHFQGWKEEVPEMENIDLWFQDSSLSYL